MYVVRYSARQHRGRRDLQGRRAEHGEHRVKAQAQPNAGKLPAEADSGAPLRQNALGAIDRSAGRLRGADCRFLGRRRRGAADRHRAALGRLPRHRDQDRVALEAGGTCDGPALSRGVLDGKGPRARGRVRVRHRLVSIYCARSAFPPSWPRPTPRESSTMSRKRRCRHFPGSCAIGRELTRRDPDRTRHAPCRRRG